MMRTFAYLFYRFDWQEKLLEKTIRTELQMQAYLQTMDTAMEAIRGLFFDIASAFQINFLIFSVHDLQ